MGGQRIDTIAARIGERLADSGFDRSVKIDLRDGRAILINGSTVTTGDGDAECTISMSAEDFEALISGELDPSSAYMSGKMRIEGDMMAAMALSQVL